MNLNRYLCAWNLMIVSIEETQSEVVEEFSFFEDWMDKYEHIIELGKDLPIIAKEYKTEDYLIKGCQSQVWLHAIDQNGLISFTADSDAIITKGMVALIIRVLSGHTAKEIIACDLHFAKDIGLQEHLSPTRSNGLLAMIKQIKFYALVYDAKQKTAEH